MQSASQRINPAHRVDEKGRVEEMPAKFVSQHVMTAQQVAADTLAGVSVVSAGYAWLGTAHEVAQLVASVVAVVAGSAAAWWHIERIRDIRRERKAAREEAAKIVDSERG